MREELAVAVRKSIVISRSDKPSAVLRTLGIKSDLLPKENTTTGILEMLKEKCMKQKRVAIIGNASGSKNLKNGLESKGSTVLELPLFSYSSYLDETVDNVLREMGYLHEKPKIKSISKLIKDILNGKVHVITFTSPPSVLPLLKVADEEKNLPLLLSTLNESVVVVSVGPSTTDSLEQNHISVDVMPKVHKMGPMVCALADHIRFCTYNPDQKTKLTRVLKNVNVNLQGHKDGSKTS
jgi:uroporphyrinogen-III synthase